MSSTRSSRPSSRRAGLDAFVQTLVSERAGREWCLFLDRDGVINRRIVGDYVRAWADFEWLPGAQRAFNVLRGWAPQLVVVTNQQGIGKGLMSRGDVDTVHDKIREQLAANRVSIDAILVCPHLESVGCECRKPMPGLALDWLEQHPGVDQSLCVMVGDSPSDLEFAQRIAVETGGCPSVQIGGDAHQIAADASFASLLDFAVAVRKALKDERPSC
jgi:histidinol-phosphate phosphatase family protein